MANWPSTLPQSLNLQAGYEREDGVLRSQMDTGPAKVRRRFTAVPKTYSGEMLIDGAQLATLESFFENDLAMGALSFYWTDPKTDATVLMRFKEPYTGTVIAGSEDSDRRYWRISMTLEVLP